MPHDTWGRFARLYYNLREKYPDIWADDTRLSTFVRLLTDADEMWDVKPMVPRSVDGPTFDYLVEAGIVEPLPGDRYTIAGLDEMRQALREQQSRAGRASGEARRKRASERPSNERPTGVRTDAEPLTTVNSQRSTTTVTTPRRRAKTSDVDLPDIPGLTMTAEQRDSWERLSSKRWDAFKVEWLGRGFRFAPSGDYDDKGSQLSLVWEMVDARPQEAADWVRDAPGKTATSVVGYMLDKWRAIKAAVPPDPKPKQRNGGASDWRALGDVIGDVAPTNQEKQR